MVVLNFLISCMCYVDINDNVKVYELRKRRGVAEQKYKREADWKEAGEERSDERAWILSHNISGTSYSEEYWYYPQYPILIITRKVITKNAFLLIKSQMQGGKPMITLLNSILPTTC